MPPRKAHGHYALHAVTYDQDDIPRDEVMASMTAKIVMLAA